MVAPTLFIASLISFFSVCLIPGSIIDLMLMEHPSQDREASREALLSDLGLDVPLYIQYGRWLGFIPQKDGAFRGALQGDLGLSLWTKTTVASNIIGRIPITVELGLLGLIISQIIALPIGVFSAIRQDTAGDYLARSFAILCIAIPDFWFGTLIIVFFSIWWGWSPPLLVIPFFKDPIGNLQMFIVPATILGMGLSGITMRMTRTMMLEVLRQDYIRTAWAKGLSEKIIVTRHALRNALIPIITIVGMQVPIVIGGAVIIEQIFALPGVGRLLVNATAQRDYTIVSGVVLTFSIATVFANLEVDLIYSYLNPKIRFK